jgi:hypothetical protein
MIAELVWLNGKVRRANYQSAARAATLKIHH